MVLQYSGASRTNQCWKKTVGYALIQLLIKSMAVDTSHICYWHVMIFLFLMLTIAAKIDGKLSTVLLMLQLFHLYQMDLQREAVESLPWSPTYICHFPSGLSVIKFQEDGFFANDSYVIRTVQIGAGNVLRLERDFTICLRISLNYLRGRRASKQIRTYRLFYGVSQEFSCFLGDTNHWLKIIDRDNSYDFLSGTLEVKNGPKFSVRRYHPSDMIDEASFNLNSQLDFQNWHHYCFVFTSQAQFPYPGGYINLTNLAYLDGVTNLKAPI